MSWRYVLCDTWGGDRESAVSYYGVRGGEGVVTLWVFTPSQSKASGEELLQRVMESLNVQEKDYFGLASHEGNYLVSVR